MFDDILRSLILFRREIEQTFESFCSSHRRVKKISRGVDQAILDFRLSFWNEDKYVPEYRDEWHKLQATKTLKLKLKK